ncbi:hypothetical protein ACJX0J_036983 [Zea mays]
MHVLSLNIWSLQEKKIKRSTIHFVIQVIRFTTVKAVEDFLMIIRPTYFIHYFNGRHYSYAVVISASSSWLLIFFFTLIFKIEGYIGEDETLQLIYAGCSYSK